jgi:hypothetical protein
VVGARERWTAAVSNSSSTNHLGNVEQKTTKLNSCASQARTVPLATCFGKEYRSTVAGFVWQAVLG